MRKICFFLSTALCLLFFFSVTALAESDLKSTALKKFQQSVLKALPAETKIVRIAVLGFEGDDGTIQNAVTSAMTEKTRFKVIERKDLDKILEEQGIQLKDILDEKTRIRQGKIKGVQGLIFGKVLGWEKGFLSESLKVNLKLDDVERGEILLSKEFRIKVVAPVRDGIIYGLVGIFILLIVMMGLKRRQAAEMKTSIAEDLSARRRVTKEIERTLINLSEVKSRLMEKGKIDQAILLTDAEKDLLLLKEQVDSAARGCAERRRAGELRQVLHFDKNIGDSFESLSQSADRLYYRVGQGDLLNFEGEVDGLKKGIKNTRNEFSHRTY